VIWMLIIDLILAWCFSFIYPSFQAKQHTVHVTYNSPRLPLIPHHGMAYYVSRFITIYYIGRRQSDFQSSVIYGKQGSSPVEIYISMS
jgi:hypothetical protein